jgi:hypothetical protein
MVGKLASCFKKIWELSLNICSIFKPNTPLAKVVEDIGKLGRAINKRDHIIIVGGPGNSLDRMNA